MTGIDTNVLIDLLVKSQPGHAGAVKGLADLEDRLAITPTNIGELLRLLTHPKVFPRPLTLSKAVDTLDAFLDFHEVTVLRESEDWWKDLGILAEDIRDLRGNEVFDARIALCLKYNGVKRFWTRDSDFSKYEFLQPARYATQAK